jgi:hypothetical protein
MHSAYEGFVISFREWVWRLVSWDRLYIMTTLKTFALLGWNERVEMVFFLFLCLCVL